MAEKTSILEININAEQAIKSMTAIENELEALKKAQKDIEDGSYKSAKQLQATDEEYAKNAAKIKVLNQEMAGYRKQLANQIKAQRENEGSLTSMRAKLSDLRKQYDELGTVDREQTGGKGQKLLDEITEINNALTEAEEKSGRFQRNVGNYYGAIMASARDLMAGTGPTRPTGPMGGGGAGNSENIKRQLKELRDLQQQMKLAGLTGTKEFQDIANAIGEAKDAVGDLEAETTHYASDTAKLDELRAGFDATGDAVSGVSQTMSVFGAESQTVANIESKLQSSSMAVNSAIAVQNALQKQSALMLGIKRIQEMAAAKSAAMLAAAEGKATIAQKALNLVAKANPYVLLAGAILSVVGAFAAFTMGANKAAIAQENFNNAVKRFDEIKAENERNIEQSEHDIEVANMQDVTALNPVEEATKRLDTANKAWEKAKQASDDAEKALRDIKYESGEDSDEYKKANETYQQKEQERQDASDLVNDLRRQLSKAELQMQIMPEENAKAEYEQRAEANKQRIEQQKAANDKAIEEQRKANDMQIANMKDGFDKQRAEETANYNNNVADLKKRLKNETDLTKAARTAINQQIEQLRIKHKNAMAKIADDEQTALLNKQKDFAELRLETMNKNDADYLDAKLKSLNAEMAVELNNAETTEEQKAMIRAKYAKMESEERLADQQRKLTASQTASELELEQMRARGQKESAILKRESEQMFDAFATLTRNADESETDFQLRLTQAYNAAMAKRKEATDAEKAEAEANQQIKDGQIESYKQLADAVSGVTSAIAEGTGADETARKVTSSLAIVSGAAALAQTIEKASKASTWYEAIAEVAASVAAFVPIISNIKTLAGYANGGYVSGAGSGTSDSINARLSNGEYVVKANAVNASTLPVLNAMNGQSTGAQVGNNNFLAQQMLLAFRSMPSPVVSVQDINRGQNRVTVIESSAKIL